MTKNLRLRYFIVLSCLAIALALIPYSAIFKPPSEFDFDLSVSPSTLIIHKGLTTTCRVDVILTRESSQLVALTISGLPKDPRVSYSFNPDSGKPPFSSILTITFYSSALDGTYELTVTGASEGKIHSTKVMLTVEIAAPGH